MSWRTERDPLGEKRVPRDAYFGIQTQRAVENFPISGRPTHPAMVWAMVAVKRSAAETNTKLGRISAQIGRAIVRAAVEAHRGRFDGQFVVDAFQAGAGTSFNMNVNEVLANRAAELLGGERGAYTRVHPNDHVNLGQSTNDAFPTAMRLAMLKRMPELAASLKLLERSLKRKSDQFRKVVKPGRTHLQDAVPIRLGQEFSGYHRAIEKARLRIEEAGGHLRELNIGATAVGTGMNAHPRYQHEVVARLRRNTGLDVRPSRNLFEKTQSLADFVHFSNALKGLAVELIRIANDVRLLSSGPATGLGDIRLPAVQPGSSIMPGKVNPVIAECVDMIGFQVVGNDLTVTLASQAGQLELNVMMPVVARNILESLDILTSGVRVFSSDCVQGIEANEARCREQVERSSALATVLAPRIGYAKAAELAKEAVAGGRTIRELVVEKGLLEPEEADRVLDPLKLTGGG